MTTPELFDFNTTVIFSSIFGILGLNGLLLYFVIRHKVFIHFCLLVLGLAAHISLSLVHEDYSEFTGKLSVITALATTLGALFFTQSFIGINRSSYSNWWKIFRGLIIIALAILFIQLLNMLLWSSVVLSDSLSYVAALTTLTTLIVSFVVCFSLWRKEKLASLYFYTNLPMIGASIAYVTIWFSQQDGEFDLIPQIKLVIYGGMTTQMVLFSVFVGYKIKNAEKEKLDLERNVNQKLQEEVDKQTGSLKAAMEEVEEQKDELQSLNDLKNKLFTLVAHDLRNPLQNLSSLIELLEKNLLDPEKMAEFTQQTKVGLSESLMVMERLLHWSYKQLDGIHVQKESLDVGDIVGDVKYELQSLSKNKGIEIKSNIQAKNIWFDRDMLRVVVRNLLSNGIKFSHEKGVINISSFIADDHVCVSIEDKGVGMNPIWYEELVKTGKPEVKAGTKGEKGSGFGLLITKDFVEMNDGQLICESTINQGTTFTLKVPVKE